MVMLEWNYTCAWSGYWELIPCSDYTLFAHQLEHVVLR